ncbi:MAG: hypothetical protein PHN59_07625, partial [Candidatus Omnitrophica bacterium]|nr:hypothetical protein [Candidatus Omnitrophota bacterium]
ANKEAEIAELKRLAKIAKSKESFKHYQRMVVYYLHKEIWSPSGERDKPGLSYEKLLNMYFKSLGLDDVEAEVGMLDYDNAPQNLPLLSVWHRLIAQLLKDYATFTSFGEKFADMSLRPLEKALKDAEKELEKLTLGTPEADAKKEHIAKLESKIEKKKKGLWLGFLRRLERFNDWEGKKERRWPFRLISPLWWHNDGVPLFSLVWWGNRIISVLTGFLSSIAFLAGAGFITAALLNIIYPIAGFVAGGTFILAAIIVYVIDLGKLIPAYAILSNFDIAPFNWIHHKGWVKLKINKISEMFERSGATREFIKTLQELAAKDKDIENMYGVLGHIFEPRTKNAAERRIELRRKLANARKELKHLNANDSRAKELLETISLLEEQIVLLEPALPIITLRRKGKIIDQRVIVATAMTKKKTRPVVSKKLMDLPDGRQLGIIELVRTKKDMKGETGQTMLDWMADLFGELVGGVFRDIRAGVAPLQAELNSVEQKLREIPDQNSRKAKKLKSTIAGLTKKLLLRTELEANQQKLNELGAKDSRDARKLERRIASLKRKAQALKGADMVSVQSPKNEMEEIIRAGWVNFAEGWFLKTLDEQFKNFGIQTAALHLRHRRQIAKMVNPANPIFSGEPADFSAYRSVLMKVNKPLGDWDINLDLFYFTGFNLRALVGETLLRSNIDISDTQARANWIRKFLEDNFRGRKYNKVALDLRGAMKIFLSRVNLYAPVKTVPLSKDTVLLRNIPVLAPRTMSDFYANLLSRDAKDEKGMSWQALDRTERMFRTLDFAAQKETAEVDAGAAVNPIASTSSSAASTNAWELGNVFPGREEQALVNEALLNLGQDFAKWWIYRA